MLVFTGKPEYSLEEFGLDQEEIKARFARFDPDKRVPAVPKVDEPLVMASPPDSPPSSEGATSVGDAGEEDTSLGESLMPAASSLAADGGRAADGGGAAAAAAQP